MGWVGKELCNKNFIRYEIPRMNFSLGHSMNTF